ncbi:MAG: TM0106 family RecB-like putative nuclease, partial [Nitriliruptorales bacterium]
MPIEVEPEDWKILRSTDIRVLGTPMFENRDLRIFGTPDGIDAAGGALIPIEIKSHKDVQRTDELELAFYWLLLQPQRRRRVPPRGLLILRRDDGAEEVEVPLREHRFDEVRRLLREIREARRRGVEPRICGCNVCSKVRRDEVTAAARSRADLTLIRGIGWAYAPALEQLGIRTWRDLMHCDPVQIIGGMRERGYSISNWHIDGWKHHAASYATGAPVVFGAGGPLPEAFIALDLEYIPEGLLWLIGLSVQKPGRCEHRFMWADRPRDVKANLAELATVLRAHESLPVLTWSGDSADVPVLRSAAERYKMPEVMAPIEGRHLDLYDYVGRNLRLPIPRFGLKDVGAYFGVPRISNVSDGLEALYLYEQYARAKGRRKALLREQLIAYNRDDLDTLVEVAGRIRDLSSAQRGSSEPTMVVPAPPPN